MANKNYMYNPDGSKTEVGPDLDPETQRKVDSANRVYKVTGRLHGKKLAPNSLEARAEKAARKMGIPEPTPAWKPGTIQKALAFVSKDTNNPHWKAAEKKIVSMFDKVSGGTQDQQGLRPTMAKASFDHGKEGFDLPHSPRHSLHNTEYTSHEEADKRMTALGAKRHKDTPMGGHVWSHPEHGVFVSEKFTRFPSTPAKPSEAQRGAWIKHTSPVESSDYANLTQRGDIGKYPPYTPSGQRGKTARRMLRQIHANVERGQNKPLSKAFKYSCPDCGHTDEVATGGFGYDLQPKKWPCRKCGKENTKMTVLQGKSTPKWTDAQWKKYRSDPENTKPISAFHTGDPKPVKKADSGLPKCRLCGNDYNTYDARNLEQVRRMTKLGRCANCSDEGIKKSSGGIVPGGGPSDPRSGLNIAKPLGPTKVKKALDEFLEKYGPK
jgi:ribosomal protein L37AE/L43A